MRTSNINRAAKTPGTAVTASAAMAKRDLPRARRAYPPQRLRLMAESKASHKVRLNEETEPSPTPMTKKATATTVVSAEHTNVLTKMRRPWTSGAVIADMRRCGRRGGRTVRPNV